ncbi:unnamed protein product [Cladocopium goreaui]|uniref:Myb-like domain-containing protein n=1 Tax=Cladocopium goreaui TaxID=2562237 RepID=A0A9P1CMU3_9DINO|nr:unnamed protein product [Cladocopium goreaui]
MKRRKHQDVAAGSSKDKPKEAKKRKDQHKEEIKNKANKRSKKQEKSSLAASNSSKVQKVAKEEKVDVEAHFRSLQRRSGVPTGELPRFFAPIIPCNSDAKQRWTFRARNLQPLTVTRSTWNSSEVQRLQRVMHAELLETSFQEQFQIKAASLDVKGQQQLFAEVAAKLEGKRLRELLPERIEYVDWLNVSNKLRAMNLGVDDLPCMSVQATQRQKDAMKEARNRFGSLTAERIFCTGVGFFLPVDVCVSDVNQPADWSPEDLEKLEQVCAECGTDWQLVASRVGDFSPEECEEQWRHWNDRERRTLGVAIDLRVLEVLESHGEPAGSAKEVLETS